MIEQFVFIGFASWRIAHMLVDEEGPALIFERIREFVGANKPGKVTGFLPTLFSCVYCMSVWTTMTLFLVWQVEPVAVMLIAAMSLALVVHSIVEGRNG